MVLSAAVIALRNVLRLPLRRSTKGSLEGYRWLPHSTECSRICGTPVLSFGSVRKLTEKHLFWSGASINIIDAPVGSWLYMLMVIPRSAISSVRWRTYRPSRDFVLSRSSKQLGIGVVGVCNVDPIRTWRPANRRATAGAATRSRGTSESIATTLSIRPFISPRVAWSKFRGHSCMGTYV